MLKKTSDRRINPQKRAWSGAIALKWRSMFKNVSGYSNSINKKLTSSTSYCDEGGCCLVVGRASA